LTAFLSPDFSILQTFTEQYDVICNARDPNDLETMHFWKLVSCFCQLLIHIHHLNLTSYWVMRKSKSDVMAILHYVIIVGLYER